MLGRIEDQVKKNRPANTLLSNGLVGRLVHWPHSVGSPRVSKGWFCKRPSLTVGLLTRFWVACLSAQLLQTLGGQQQGFVFLTKAEPHLLRAECRIAVETRARYAGNADLANQMTGKLNVVFETKGANVSHDV